MPRGTLDVPADLIARSHGRGESAARRASREGRDRGERGDRGRSSERGSERRSSYSAPRQPVDDFFLKPYEPSAAGPAPKDAPVKSNGAKRQVAVLLGGSRKP